jgi:hypothetical protein
MRGRRACQQRGKGKRNAFQNSHVDLELRSIPK